MKTILIILNILIAANSWAEMSTLSCNNLLKNLMPYQGSSKFKLLNEKDFKEKVFQTKISNGLLYEDRQGLLNITMPSQLVISEDLNFYITKDPSTVDHSVLGAHKPVLFAALITIDNGLITSLVMQNISAYKGSINKMIDLILYFKESHVNLSVARISVFTDRDEDIVNEIKVEEFLNRYLH